MFPIPSYNAADLKPYGNKQKESCKLFVNASQLKKMPPSSFHKTIMSNANKIRVFQANKLKI